MKKQPVLQLQLIIVTILIIIAAFYRFYQLDVFPAEFHFDEWVEVYDALDMHENGFRIFNTSNKGREPLFTYLVALALYVVEPQDIVSRSIAASAGLLAVAVTYFLVKEMFKGVMEPKQAGWLGILTALGMAVGYWQVHFSRIGLRFTLVPLVISLVFYFLWRGINTSRRVNFIWAGLLLGISLYTYPAARFIPVVIVAFFVFEAIINALAKSHQKSLWQTHYKNLLMTILLSLLVFAPLGYYFLFVQPELFLRRANEIAIYNPNLSQGNILSTLAKSISGNFAGLVYFGDMRQKYNLPGRPIFEPLIAIAFFVGLGLAIKRFRKPPYLFAIVWWLIMMTPAFLVFDDVPSFKRQIGIAPVIYMFPAMAWLALGKLLIYWENLSKINRPLLVRTIMAIGLIVIYTGVGIITYRDYFLTWGPGHPHYQDALLYKNLADRMLEEKRDDQVWVFPTDVRNIIRRYYGLYGLFSQNLPPRQFITVDEQEMFHQLNVLAKKYSRVVLVNVKSGQEWQADPKRIFPFLLEKYGILEDVYTSSKYKYDLSYYKLDSPNTNLNLADRWYQANINFGTSLNLVEAAYGDASGHNHPDVSQVPSGETTWVVLHWRAAESIPEDYKVSIRLSTPTGSVISQVDTLMTNVRHRTTRGWQIGEDVFSYHLLPIEPGTVPGEYHLSVLVYSAENMQPVSTNPGRETGATQIGKINVSPSLTSPILMSENPIQMPWASGLQLNGYSNPPSELQWGDQFDLTLLWSGTAKLSNDETLNLMMEGQGASQELLRDVLVGGPTYLTSVWRENEAIKQLLQVQIPIDLASGIYNVILTSPDGDKEINLGQVQVKGRTRLFELPGNIQNPVNISLGEYVKLVGFNLNLTDSDTVALTLYWQSLQSMTDSYKVFVHVLDQDQQLIDQRDQIPMAGQAPTTTWLPGEIIVDKYEFSIDPVPTSDYQLAIGLYDEKTGKRLNVPNNSDNAILLPKLDLEFWMSHINPYDSPGTHKP